MASEILFAGAGLSEAPGDIAWGSPGNIVSDNNVDANTGRVETQATQRLRSTTYGFAIPTSATIDGIRVTVEVLDLEAGDLGFDLEIRLAKARVPVGGDKSLAGAWPSARTVRTYGSPTDLWGTTWTPAEINATGFGLAQRAEERGVDRADFSVDFHRIEVFFTLPVEGTLRIPQKGPRIFVQRRSQLRSYGPQRANSVRLWEDAVQINPMWPAGAGTKPENLVIGQSKFEVASTSPPPPSRTPAGFAWKFESLPAVTISFEADPLTPDVTDYPVTLAAVIRPEGGSSLKQIALSFGRITVTDIHLSIGVDANDIALLIAGTEPGGLTEITGGGTLTGVVHVIVGVFRSATDRELFLNGRSVATSAVTEAFPGATRQYAIGARAFGTANDIFDGDINAAFMWSRALTAAEILRFSQDPFQMFRPVRRRFSAAGGLFFQSVAGTLAAGDLTGALTKKTSKLLVGALALADLTGALTKKTSKFFTGTLAAGDLTGVLTKRARKVLAGSVSFAGALATRVVFTITLTGVVSFAGALVRLPKKALTGTLSFGGALTKKTSKILTGSVSFVGGLVRLPKKTLTGVVSFAGALDTRVVFTIALTGAVSFVGVLTKKTQKLLAGTLSFGGALTKKTSKILAGSLSFVGVLTKKPSKLLTGAVSFVGGFQARAILRQTLTGVLSFVGVLAAQIVAAPAVAIHFGLTIISAVRNMRDNFRRHWHG